jgi:predicted outer membrane repeat protein
MFNQVFNVVLKIEFCRVHRSACRFLQLTGQTVQINVLNTQVEDFINPSSEGGGVFNINASRKCDISIINSSFRNGKNPASGGGGVVSVVSARSTTLLIQNSTMQNVSNENELGYGYGGALYMTSRSHDNVSLNILNSSFLDNLSRQGGAVAIFSSVSLTVINSIFMRNKALNDGGSFYIQLNYKSTLKLQNVSFIGNSARCNGGAIYVDPPNAMFSFVATEVNFVRNKAAVGGALSMPSFISNLRISFEESRFIENTAEVSASAVVLQQLPTDQFIHVILRNCVFKGNYGYDGSIFLEGKFNISCHNSTFSSNSADNVGGAISLKLGDSILKVSNTTFLNNSCRNSGGGAIGIRYISNTKIIITGSIFVNNTAFGGTGGAISVSAAPDQINKTICKNVQNPRSWFYINRLEFHRVHFQGNVAKNGNAMHINNGLVSLRDCLIMDNFGFASGSQLVIYGSASLKIYNSIFKETIDKTSLNGKEKEFVFSPFFVMYGSGPLVIRNSTVDQRINTNDPLIVVSKTGLLEFDNYSMITCPLGSSLIKSDTSYMNNGLNGCDNPVTVTVIRLFCQQCNSKYYSLQIGQSKGLNIDKGFVCTPCPYGAECFPSIKSKDNFWGYKSGSHPPTLTFTRCPVDYCKSPKPDSDTYNACVGKRTGMMCGTCSRGYTETLLSTHCKLTKDCKRGWFWIAFLTLVCLTALLLIFKPPVITFLVKQVLWFKKLSCRRSANHQHDNVIQALSSEEVRRENG